MILKRIPGKQTELVSSEGAAILEHSDCFQHAIASPQYLNVMNVVGVPPHKVTQALIVITSNLNFFEPIVNEHKTEILGASTH